MTWAELTRQLIRPRRLAVDPLSVLSVEVYRCDLPVVLNYVIDCSLMWSQRLDILLS